MSAAQLLSLVDLITNAVKVVIAEHDTVGKPLPTLDEPVAGPFDEAKAITPDLSTAVKVIEAACAQLALTVTPPSYTILMKATSFQEPACLEFVIYARLANLLQNKPEGVHVDDLAKQSGLDADKIGRVLRMLATRHFFKEVGPNVFANNRLSRELISEDEDPSMHAHMTSQMRPASFFKDTLTDPKTAHSKSPSDNSFTRAYGMPAFEYYQHAPAQESRIFQKAMAGYSNLKGTHLLPKLYNWSSLPAGSTLCDVGGGMGHIAMDIYREFPQLRPVVQDLPNVVEQGREYWKKECPSAITNGDVSFVPLDFFKETPVQHSDIYFLSYCLHDWPDAQCEQILTNIRGAMKPASRLLINELIVKNTLRSSGTTGGAVEQAPEPLLANYGMGGLRASAQDFFMMTSFNSKERTFDEYLALTEKTGYKFVKLWEIGDVSLLEFAPA